MKDKLIVCLPNDSSMGIGGGFTFLRNLKQAGKKHNLEFTKCVSGGRWDVALICGATMITRDTMRKLRQFQVAGKKIVLRVDGIPEDWRNRNTGWSRLSDFYDWSAAVVYQSDFVKRTVGRMLAHFRGKKEQSKVILNGVNENIFKPSGQMFSKFGEPSLMFVYYRGDPNKNLDEVIVRFREYKLDNPKATITFIGSYPKRADKHLSKWNFGLLDWKENKDWQWIGTLKDRNEMAKALRTGDYIVYPALGDPCPNTLIEAMSCGLKPLWIKDYGGQGEIVKKWDEVDWSRDRMAKEYRSFFEKVVSKNG